MSYYPRTDVSKGDSGLVMKLAIPGLSVNNVTLEFSGSTLVVSGRHKERDKYSTYTHKELYTGHFIRKYIINTKQFDVTKITSKMLHGMLTINIPYKNTAKIPEVETIPISEDNKNGD